jgi:hypothetical protein
LLFAAVGYVLARNAAPRVTARFRGWLATLPASGTDHRRAAIASIAASEVAVLLFAAAAAVAAPLAYRSALAAEKLVALPLALLAAAALATPVRHRVVGASCAACALFSALLVTWWSVAAAVAFLVAHDQLAGPLEVGAERARRRLRMPIGFSLRVAFRAMGVRQIGPLPLAALMLAASYFFRRNNTLTESEAALAARWGGLLAATVYVAGVADLLGVRRPAWTWARSLPVTSTTRAAQDALVLAIPALLCVLADARQDWHAALVTLATLPLLAAIAAGAMRYRGERLTRAGGEFLLEAVPIAVVVANVPALCFLALVLTPFALRLAAWRERRLRVSDWRELHHAAVGDAAAWSAQ